MSNALDVLLGYTVVERRGAECRIVAYDREGRPTVYADWCEPVQVIEPAPIKKRFSWRKKVVDK